jgi:hypothetical protein
MYNPKFPYKGNQLILTSDRVTIHAKNDAIFLFGKQAVSLSSTNTINLDASNKIILAGPVIELGNKAETLGQPLVLGRDLNQQLSALAQGLKAVAAILAQVSESNLGASMQSIASAGGILYTAGDLLLTGVGEGNPDLSKILSKNTFTR